MSKSIHRHQTPPQYCHVIHRHRARCSLHLWASRPLWPNVMSSIKPGVHNVAQRHPRMTKKWPQGIRTQNFVPIGPVVPVICSQTDRGSQYSTPLLGWIKNGGTFTKYWMQFVSNWKLIVVKKWHRCCTL